MAKNINSLDIWFNGEYVGVWGKHRGQETFQYDPSWLTNKYARVLSLSLPFTPGNQVFSGDVVRFYFDNLLPDSRDIRERMATKFSANGISAFELLAEIGRDCVGAIQILPAGEEPQSVKSIQYQALDDSEVTDILRNTVGSNVLGLINPSNDLRLSLAGAQEKTALLWCDNRWCRPLGSTPTTHILKLPMGLIGNMNLDLSHSVENEWLCSKIIREYGLPVAHCDMAYFEDMKVLVVERFDRKLSPDEQWIMRLAQEDFCQAKGLSPLDKYQKDGGLGITDGLRLLDGSIQAKKDKEIFFKAQIIFWIMCATDGHAKNFSLKHFAGNHYKLAPLYDVLSVYPVIGKGKNQLSFYDAKLAMSIDSKNKHYRVKEILRRHFINHGIKTGFSQEDVNIMLDEIALSAGDVIKNVKQILPNDFPSIVSDKIFEGMIKQADKLLG